MFCLGSFVKVLNFDKAFMRFFPFRFLCKTESFSGANPAIRSNLLFLPIAIGTGTKGFPPEASGLWGLGQSLSSYLCVLRLRSG